MKVKSIAECSPWSILQYFWPAKGSMLQYFWPALSDNQSWKPERPFDTGFAVYAIRTIIECTGPIYCYWYMFSPVNHHSTWLEKLIPNMYVNTIIRQGWLVNQQIHWFGNLEGQNSMTAWYTDWWQAGGREAQANMKETHGERLPWVEAHDTWPSRKEHLEIRCEICYACS